jgi:hypothetical protein
MVTKELCPEAFGAALPSYVVTPNAAMPIPRSGRARLTFVYSVHLREQALTRNIQGKVGASSAGNCATGADHCRLNVYPIEPEESR